MRPFFNPSSLSKIITTAALGSLLACSSSGEDGAGAPGAGGFVSAAGTNAIAGNDAIAGGGTTSAGGAPAAGGASAGADNAGTSSNAGAAGAGMAGAAAGGGIVGPSGLVHPGVLVNRGMLDFVKAKIEAGAQPWKGALDKAKSSNFGSLGYTAKPRATVECGPTSNPDVGCSDEKNDVVAAFTHALIWYHTRDKRYGDKAIQIMNAWSAVLKGHTNDNTQLQAAWCSEVFTRAAEIMRYSDSGWAQADIDKFSAMLKTVYLPQVANGSTRTGNWDTSAIEAAMNIAVFLDDKPQFDKAVALWQARTPAYIYLKTDGALPKQAPREAARSDSALRGYWWDPKAFVDGITQETCRDRPGSGTAGFGHAQYGVAAIINAAETARIQGVDLFAMEQPRLTAYLEFHAKYLNGASIGNLCNTAIAAAKPDPMWEIGYNAYANVLGQPLPETKKLVESIRPTGSDHHMVWETLTHGDIGKAGL